METVTAKIEKLVGQFSGGLATEAEVVNELLLTFANLDEEQDLSPLFDLLPNKLKEAVLRRLNDLESKEFQWRPFVIGEGFNEAELERLNKKLRIIQRALVNPDRIKR